MAAAQVIARPGRLDQSVAAHVRMVDTAADCGAEFVIFPELSLTGYRRTLTHKETIGTENSALLPLVDISQRRRIVIVVGAPIASAAGLLIASLCFRPDGRITMYTKQFLHDGEETVFIAGEGGDLVTVGSADIGLAICAEIKHPSHVRNAVEIGATVYAASCFFTPTGYAADTAKLQQYAEGHNVVVMMANFCGVSGGFESAGGSAVWDKTGRLLIAAPSSGECIVLAEHCGDEWNASLKV